MRIPVVTGEPRLGKDYARELDAEAYAKADSVEQRIEAINDVSYLQLGEAAILFNLYAEAAENGLDHLPALEIGARFGCSTMALALAIREHEGAPLVSVDPHGFVPARGHLQGSYDIMRENLAAAELAEHVIPILSVSETVGQWWQHPLSLVFVDGNHAAEAVARDIEIFAPHVAPGGVLCGHDYFPEQTDTAAVAVNAYIKAERRELEVRQSIWIIR